MKHYQHDPCGETGPMRSQTDQAMASGWRKPTQALLNANHLGREGMQTQVEKGRAILAVKRVAAHIGLKATDLLLLDTLFAFSKPQDWAQGQRPIVWPSNAFLMEQTGFSKSTLKRHARRLVEAGLITFYDSPNGKRWGRRDDDGLIVEAYGFDLAPVAARTEELEATAKQVAHERALCLKLKRQITILRRTIRAQLETTRESGLGQKDGSALQDTFNGLLRRLSGALKGSEVLGQLVTQFESLCARTQALLHPEMTQLKKTDVDPTEVIDEPHIQTTQKNSQILSNEDQQAEPVAQKKQTQPIAMEVRTLLSACPQFTAWARDVGGMLRDWGDLHLMSCKMRPMIGISDRTWSQAVEQMGPQQATKALALVFDKHCCGEVKSPGGYLRGMIEKSRLGTLHLERSVFGRLNAQPS